MGTTLMIIVTYGAQVLACACVPVFYMWNTWAGNPPIIDGGNYTASGTMPA
jgi:hypothetical protein